VVTGTGLTAQKIVQEALLGPSEKKIIAQMPQDIDEALSSARQVSCALLVQLAILDWYDPPFFANTIPDYIEINVRLFSAENGELLRMDNISCAGSYNPAACLKPGLHQWAAEALY
jgi:hypothetical protein